MSNVYYRNIYSIFLFGVFVHYDDSDNLDNRSTSELISNDIRWLYSKLHRPIPIVTINLALMTKSLIMCGALCKTMITLIHYTIKMSAFWIKALYSVFFIKII